MSALNKLKIEISKAIKNLTDQDISPDNLTLSSTRKEFEGDYTLLVFPLTRHFGKKPEDVGQLIGKELKLHSKIIKDFNTIKGFLNLSFSNNYWIQTLNDIQKDPNFGKGKKKDKKVMIEFSSPNTNKPLHLGHIRNILLGWSVSKILDAAGYDVVKTQVVNDRGIAICKSMLAWKKWGAGITPSNSGKKGDFLVGDFYVKFNKEFTNEYTDWQKSQEAENIYLSKGEDTDKKTFYSNYQNDYFNEYSNLGSEARKMLLKWEDKDPETMDLWKNMNKWVLDGFEETYEKLGVNFTKSYFESYTYILGKSIVEDGLKQKVFYTESDGSIWVDLTDVKMDKKIVLRSDGTSLYITQDIGTAELRFNDFNTEKMIYVVGDEQEYHFKVLFEIMKRLKKPYADGMYHLSYGMVELPTGKMKSREGKVVDADDLMKEMESEARNSAEERGVIAETLQGQTGPYIQNAYVRIKSILRRANSESISPKETNYNSINTHEKSLISTLSSYPEIVQEAAKEYEPSLIANYSYNLAKKYHKFYSEVRVLGIDDIDAKVFRLELSKSVATTLKNSMDLLGIEMPERM